MELPLAFVNGAMFDLSPGDGDTEVLDDMLPLLEDILDLFPAFGCGAGSWWFWKCDTTGEWSLDPCDELGCDGG